MKYNSGIVDLDESVYNNIISNLGNVGSELNAANSAVKSAIGCLSGELASAIGSPTIDTSSIESSVNSLINRINMGI